MCFLYSDYDELFGLPSDLDSGIHICIKILSQKIANQERKENPLNFRIEFKIVASQASPLLNFSHSEI